MTNILDLPDWNVLSSRLDDGVYTIEAEYTKPLQACTKCGLIGKLYRHGPKVVAYRDSPIRGAHAQLEAKVQRYKCRECGGTSLQPLEGIEVDRRMTKRCVEYIKTQCLRDTFTRLAEHIGCDEKTVRNIANDYVHYMNTQFKPYLPNWLGIDETQITNGYTEALNGMTKVMNRNGRGYTFDIIRARVLFSKNQRAGKSPEWICISCGGLFYTDEFYSHVDAEKLTCICEDCHDRVREDTHNFLQEFGHLLWDHSTLESE